MVSIVSQPVSSSVAALLNKISIRPSGTEPKIKFYFGTKAKLNDIAEFESVEKEIDDKLSNLTKIFVGE